jgi:hypothetical protein
MSTTAYWMPVVPEQPSGSNDDLKYLLFDEGSRMLGHRAIVEQGSERRVYLQGFRDALPAGERRDALSEFLADLSEHKALTVWIDE